MTFRLASRSHNKSIGPRNLSFRPKIVLYLINVVSAKWPSPIRIFGGFLCEFERCVSKSLSFPQFLRQNELNDALIESCAAYRQGYVFNHPVDEEKGEYAGKSEE